MTLTERRANLKQLKKMEYSRQKNTIETHPWFKTEIELVKKRMQREKRQEEEKKRTEKINDKLEIFWMIALYTIISYLTDQQHLLLFVRVPTVWFYYLSIYAFQPLLVDEEFGINDEDIQLYMRFTRPGLYYKHTHYIFDRSKIQLEKTLQKIDQEVEEYKLEVEGSRDSHDKYIDTPLDTFCSTTCGCNKEVNEYCSQWMMYSYPSFSELCADVEKSRRLPKDFPMKLFISSYFLEKVCKNNFLEKSE